LIKDSSYFTLTLGIGNIEPNIATDKPAVAPIATIARHFGAPTYDHMCNNAEPTSIWSYGTTSVRIKLDYEMKIIN
jgi:hypothetical protein